MCSIVRTLPITLLCVASVSGQTIYHTTPDWISTGVADVSTGGALVDIDRDGWLDFVVSNGNDISQQQLVVYYNNGDGTFPTTPNWQSADSVYNGHLDVADVNGDGWPDVAVSTLGEFDTTGPIARLYLNNAGTLSSTPDWSANVIGNAFGLAFGDMNNDGRPDLAVATGWSYSPQHAFNNYVYLNVNGALGASPAWTSADQDHAQGAHWVDADNDGWLDLVLACSRTRTRCYRNLGGTLETVWSWQLSDVAGSDAIMAASGDINADGRPDLVFADNNQLASGTGRFRQYNGATTGLFQTTASWTYNEGQCSAVALADLDNDGDLDLATGAWFDRTRLFLNGGTALPTTPTWTSGGTSVVEKICLGDLRNAAVRTRTQGFTGDGVRKLFHLPRQPVQEIVEVRSDGIVLTPSEYTASLEFGWITVAAAPASDLLVTHCDSLKLDMAITNWDQDKGNYIYYNQLPIDGDLDGDGDVDAQDLALLLSAWMTHSGDPLWNAAADLDGDGTIGPQDLALLLSNWGIGG